MFINTHICVIFFLQFESILLIFCFSVVIYTMILFITLCLYFPLRRKNSDVRNDPSWSHTKMSRILFIIIMCYNRYNRNKYAYSHTTPPTNIIRLSGLIKLGAEKSVLYWWILRYELIDANVLSITALTLKL